MRKSYKLIAAAAAASLVVIGGTAFTNTNTVAASDAGSGTTAIGAYSTSDIQYNPDSTNPENLASVKFTLDKVARYVAIQTHDGGVWFRSDDLRLSLGTVDSCTSSDNLTWTCDVSGADDPATLTVDETETVVGATSLTVVATS